MGNTPSSRREFLRRATVGAVVAGTSGKVFGLEWDREIRPDPARGVVPAGDKIGLATIGMGGQGSYDTTTALKVPGVELVAVADVYDGRLIRAKEVWGEKVFTSRDYREVLARPDVDAVLIGTPDHWHAQVSIDAMEAGKDVYCEKPMVHSVAEGYRVIETQRKTGR